MRRQIALLLAISCSSLVGCTTQSRATHQKLLAVAGKQAVDCGYLRERKNRQAMNRCIDSAQQMRQPFIARYDVPGKNSLVTLGIASDPDGNLFRLTYDHDPTGGNRDPVFINPDRVLVVPCSSPPNHDNHGTLTCQ